jgi:hypothetical protein
MRNPLVKASESRGRKEPQLCEPIDRSNTGEQAEVWRLPLFGSAAGGAVRTGAKRCEAVEGH